MSTDNQYQVFEEKRANVASTTRILKLLRATEPGIIIETPEMAETVSEITRLAATSEARDIAPKWLNEDLK